MMNEAKTEKYRNSSVTARPRRLRRLTLLGKLGYEVYVALSGVRQMKRRKRRAPPPPDEEVYHSPGWAQCSIAGLPGVPKL
jgi:hypothetical protein